MSNKKDHATSRSNDTDVNENLTGELIVDVKKWLFSWNDYNPLNGRKDQTPTNIDEFLKFINNKYVILKRHGKEDKGGV
jgi:hypothetical protein